MTRGTRLFAAVWLVVAGLASSFPGVRSAGAEAVPPEGSVIRLNLDGSVILDTEYDVKRISIAKPETADVLVISPRQILLIGKGLGKTNLVFWSEAEVPTAREVVVGVDLEKIRGDLEKIAPGEEVELTPSGDSLILSGTASNPLAHKRVLDTAKANVRNVVDLVKVSKVEQVLLQIRVAEVDRSVAKELGFNLLFRHNSFKGILNPPGSFDTAGAVVRNGAVDLLAETSSLTNLFVAIPGTDARFAALVHILEDKGALKTLAEPNLVVASGDEGRFLVGGEFPVVIASAAGSGAAASVDYKEFGIRLHFKPTVVPNGDIYLKIMQEVSELDFANGVAVSGFQLPALKSRKTESGLQLGDGQTFVLAGLIDNKTNKKVSKIPLLGDIPILGALFRSTRYTNSETELMVMVTPKIVRPLEKEEIPALPTEQMAPEEVDPSLLPR